MVAGRRGWRITRTGRRALTSAGGSVIFVTVLTTPRSQVCGLFLVAVMVWAAPLPAQPPPAEPSQRPGGAPGAQFEVASIKPNNSGDFRRAIGPGPGGRFQGLNVSLRELVTFAFNVDMSLVSLQVAGGPSWIDQEKFDVDAVAPAGATWPGEARAMVAAMLADRFKLKAHRERRETPVYHLVMDRNDRRPGAMLRVSTIDCEARRAAARRGAPPPPAPGPPPNPATVRPVCGVRQAPGRVAGDAVSMTQVASALAPFAGRIVLDRTELGGYFDIDLEWTPDPAAARPDGAPDASADRAAPGLFTAVREQLGLRLEAATAPIEQVVIDAAERPAPN
jgi:uncharacterized protein (TIGR03435 family)